LGVIRGNSGDEEASAPHETTVDERLAGTGMNSREKEQGAPKQPTEDRSLANGLLNAVRAAAAPKPPFRMEIVEAQGVRYALFDAETGKPVQPTADSAGPSPHGPAAGPLPAASGTAPQAGGDKPGDKSLDDFPVEFNQPH